MRRPSPPAPALLGAALCAALAAPTPAKAAPPEAGTSDDPPVQSVRPDPKPDPAPETTRHPLPVPAPTPTAEPAPAPHPEAAPTAPTPVPTAQDPGTRAWSPSTGQVEAPPPAYEPVAPQPVNEQDAKGQSKSDRRQARRNKPRKWGFPQPMIWPRVGLGASFGSFNHDIRVGGGATYFLRFGIGFGLDFDNRFIIFRDSAKAEFPGIEKETPTYIAELTPHIQWIIIPNRGFTPYIRAGVGPVFYNNGLGTLGQWTAGGGFMFRIRGRLFVDLGAMVSAQFPDSKYREVWTYQDNEPICGLSDDICSLSVQPRIGISFGFGIPMGKR